MRKAKRFLAVAAAAFMALTSMCTAMPQSVVHAEDGGVSDYPESSHDYENGMDYTWPAYTIEGASCLKVTFSAETYFEFDADYLYVYDGDGNEVGIYTGSNLMARTIYVPGDTVVFRMTSNDSVTYYGFKVTEISAAETSQLVEVVDNYIKNSSEKIFEFTPSESSFYRLKCTDANISFYDFTCIVNGSYVGTDGIFLQAGRKYIVDLSLDSLEADDDYMASFKFAKLDNASQYMAYVYTDHGTMNIFGIGEDGYIRTTFSDEGYYTVLRFDDEDYEYDGNVVSLSFSGNDIPVNVNDVLFVTPKITFSDDGMFAIVAYTITNMTSQDRKISLGVNCDVDIDGDDEAAVYVTDTGLMMESDGGKAYYLICNNVEGISEADAMWFGEYDGRAANQFNDYTQTSLTDADSVITVSWQNRVVPAGSSIVIKYELGIGNAGSIVSPDAAIIASGECGEALRWTLSKGGVLSIRGTGAMADYEIGEAPWYDPSLPLVNVKMELLLLHFLRNHACFACYHARFKILRKCTYIYRPI